MADVPALGLANTVTGFAILFAGLLTLALTLFVNPQPFRWAFVYCCIAVAGVCTIAQHGFGEGGGEAPHRPLWTVLESAGYLLVGWACIVGVLGDYYTGTLQRRVGILAGLLVGVVIWTLSLDGPTSQPAAYALALGAYGGFYVGETVVFGLAALVGGLLYFRRGMIAPRARPLLYLTVGILLVGMVFATAGQAHVESPFHAYHALWHLLSAFGCVAFWAFNHVRFRPQA